MSYAEALKRGFDLVRKDKALTNNHIKTIQEVLEKNKAGFRSVPGTTLQNEKEEVVYTPPQNKRDVLKYMNNLEEFINNDELSSLDPLIKMAIIHHQFESIHPFYDSNGRTGRIINILYIVIKELLDIPILYLSRFIITNKADYYKLLQKVREDDDWESWILFVLKGIEETAGQTIDLVKEIGKLMQEYKTRIKVVLGKSYSHELINNLFSHPYTKIQYVMDEVEVVRITATRYLDELVAAGLLKNNPLNQFSFNKDGERPKPKIKNKSAVSGFIFGLIGLFILGFIFGIIGIVKSKKGLNQIKNNPERYKTSSHVLGIIGLVTSIIGTVLWTLVLIVVLLAIFVL